MKRLVTKGDIYKATGIIRIDDLADANYLAKGDQGIFLFREVSTIAIVKGQISYMTIDGTNTTITFNNTCYKETLDVYSGSASESSTNVTWSTGDNCWLVA